MNIMDRIDGRKAFYFSIHELDSVAETLAIYPDAVVIISSSYLDDSGEFGYPSTNLEILKNYPTIKGLQVVGGAFSDFTPLKNLKQLEFLDLSFISDLKYDFQENRLLRHLELNWSKHVDGLNELTELEVLSLAKYKSLTGDLSPFSNWKKLKSLSLSDSDFNSINGLEEMNNLELLEFNRCKKINFEGVSISTVKELSLEKCSSVDLSFIQAFPKLEKLSLFGQATIESIKPILDGLPRLKYLSILNTKILESDNRYWLDYKNRVQFEIQEQKHHLLKEKDLID